jgi:hypothetical protein
MNINRHRAISRNGGSITEERMMRVSVWHMDAESGSPAYRSVRTSSCFHRAERKPDLAASRAATPAADS